MSNTAWILQERSLEMNESTSNPFQGPTTADHDSKPSPPPSSRLRSCLLLLAVTGAGFAMLAALLLPAVRTARPAAFRTQCRNNLKQLYLGIHNYQDVYGQMPPLYTVDADGRPLHNWRVLLLPYVDHQTLYENIDLSVPWNDPVNAKFAAQMPDCFRCPSTDLSPGLTTYVANTTNSPRFPELLIGPHATETNSPTLLIYELPPAGAVPWMAPHDDHDGAILRSISESTETAHTGGINYALTNGSVQFMSSQASKTDRAALLGKPSAAAPAEGNSDRDTP